MVCEPKGRDLPSWGGLGRVGWGPWFVAEGTEACGWPQLAMSVPAGWVSGYTFLYNTKTHQSLCQSQWYMKLCLDC